MAAPGNQAAVEFQERDWHVRPLPAVLSELETRPTGLSSDEARERLERFGPNQLPRQPGPTIWLILLRQFQNPLIYILLIAAAPALNAAIGGYQERRAEA